MHYTIDAEDLDGVISILEKIGFKVEQHGEILFLTHAYTQYGKRMQVFNTLTSIVQIQFCCLCFQKYGLLQFTTDAGSRERKRDNPSEILSQDLVFFQSLNWEKVYK